MENMSSSRPIGLIACLVVSAAFPAAGLDTAPLQAFFDRHCYECHDDASAKGGLDLAALKTDLSDAAAFETWERIFDRVKSGEMPPESEPRPEAGAIEGFLAHLTGDLTEAHLAEKGTVLRRLNRREYENTLNDLFGTQVRVAAMLPEDGRAEGFDTVGEALGLSTVQMERYLQAAGAVLDAAIEKRTAPPVSEVRTFSYGNSRDGKEFIGKAWHRNPDGAVVFYRRNGYPSGMLREANVPKAGYYRVRVTGYAHQSDRPVTFSLGANTYKRGAEIPTFGWYAMPPGAPTTVEVETWIDGNYMIQIEPEGISDRNNEIREKGIANYRGPGLAILSIEIEGPIVAEFPSRGHRLIFDGMERREIPPGNPKDREKSWYVPKFETVVPGDPAALAAPALRRVAERAFRRPVDEGAVSPYVALFQAELAGGADFETALRTAVTGILCAPDFLFFRERAGRLDDYQVASRLSYFLTRTAPDEDLLAAAAAGKLTGDPAALIAQADRLLKSPKAARFVADFTDAWLDLRNIEFTSPDERLFPEFDRWLQQSMVDETRAYFAELIASNRPASHLVKSDFAMLNSRLAAHYGIDGVEGPKLRRVALPADSVRGGFLTQGSVLKVSANGTNTSPVVRGAWVLERILGVTPPPPPPAVPGVEPDIRGATTLREQLDKHRHLESCQGCHRLIDPPGFALESFDPIGGWRDHFRSLGEGERVDTEVNGRRVQYKLGRPVDAAGAFRDGRAFSGYVEFREHLAAEPDTLSRTLATKLLVFATGREMGFSDRPVIDEIVRKNAAKGHGVRDLLHAVIQSDLFLTK